jgi:hypothetical protein
VLVIGDSHANHWVPGIKAEHGPGVLNIGEGACPFFERIRSEGRLERYPKFCDRTMTRAFQVLQTMPSLTSVVLSSRAAATFAGPPYGSLDTRPDQTLHLIGVSEDGLADTNAAIYAHELRYTLAKLTALGKDITYVLQVPELGFNPTSCVRLRPTDAFKTVRAPCSVSRADVERRQHEYRTVARGVLKDFPNVKVFDPLPVICNAESCDAQSDGTFIYRDVDHMTVEGSKRVWHAMASDGH